MTRKRFKQVGDFFIDREDTEISYACANEIDCKNIVNKLNDFDKENEHLRNDNLMLFGLLGDIRALLRTGDIDTVIKKINKIEKEMQQ